MGLWDGETRFLEVMRGTTRVFHLAGFAAAGGSAFQRPSPAWAWSTNERDCNAMLLSEPLLGLSCATLVRADNQPRLLPLRYPVDSGTRRRATDQGPACRRQQIPAEPGLGEIFEVP